MTAAAISSTLAILTQVLIGFLIVRHEDLSLPAHTEFPASDVLMSIPVVCLGIALLVSILAHGVGLFLQQEHNFNHCAAPQDPREETSGTSAPLFPGYILALIAFATSALLGVVAILIAGALLLALLAYYRDLWRRPLLGPVCLAGAATLSVLLGAAAGGWRGQVFLLPALLLACFAPAVYTWASETTCNLLPRRGRLRWLATITAGVVSAVLIVWAFCSEGVAALRPWLSVWLGIWLVARTASLHQALERTSGAQVAQTVSWQLQRGELLLLVTIIVALQPEWQGAIAFGSVCVAFPVLALLGRKG